MICDILAGSSRATRWLEITWLVRLGRISYGVYLWHWPVYFQLGVLWRPGESAAPLGLSVLAWGLTVAAAALSYFLIERPFLMYKARLSAKPRIDPVPAPVVPPATKNGGLALPANL